MAIRGGKVTWYSDSLTPRMMGFQVVMEQVFEELIEQAAEEVQMYAQENAPWDDRTGDARSGLTAEADTSGLNLAIVLYHTVDYGIWLEVRNGGEYAIIIPTIEQMGPVVMGALGGAFAVA